MRIRIGEWVRDRLVDHEKVKNYATALQSAVVSAAVLIGGIWSLMLYHTLHQAEKAKAELAVLGKDAVANVTLNATEIPVPGDTNAYLHVVAQVENIGNREARLDFSQAGPLRVVRLSPAGSGRLRAGPAKRSPAYTLGETRDSLQPLQRVTMRPGERRTYDFLVRVDGPGLYFVELDMPLLAQDGTPSPHWFWTSRTIVNVHGRRVRTSKCRT